MSADNIAIGRNLYGTGDTESKAWFEQQWRIWPVRADERLTTNIALHYGGVQQFRVEHGRDPEMSHNFRSHVEWHDRHRSPADAE